VTAIIDCDQHLYEPRTLWVDHADPADRGDALRIEDDDRGYAWITWRGQRLGMADVQAPGETEAIGERRKRQQEGAPAPYRYDDVLPDDFWEPVARAARIRAMGFDAAMCFPNFGLLWERRVGVDLPALLTNMSAWNRWCATVTHDAGSTLQPVAHLTLRDLEWLDDQLARLATAGVRVAMIAPALVDAKPLSHPDLERAWRSFVDHGVTPVFHVADQPRVFDDAWYTDDGVEGGLVNVVESVFLSTPAALALTDLIVNGVLERLPELRIGVVELSAVWVPQYLMMLDGGYAFTSKLNGRVPARLSMPPGDYFRRQVRIAAFSYELPERLERQSGDLFMACSDYPHSEGTATPIEDYHRTGCDPAEHAGLFGDNAAFLLRT
jgi:predicted TIM-barrel fold metal-dependent hydrolase